MIRSHLCEIAGIKRGTFDVHRKNGDLPFSTEQFQAQDGESRSWSNFTLDHAVALIAARQLVASQGLTWSNAAKILREERIYVGPVGEGQHYYERSGVFLAHVEFSNGLTNDDPQLMKRTKAYVGELAAIIDAANGEAEAYSERRNSGKWPSKEYVAVASIAAVDLSLCHYLALKAARQKNIPLDADWLPDVEA